MPTYTQANRPLQITTPLGADKIFLIGLTGQEAISRLFAFRLELFSKKEETVAFDKLLGQPIGITVQLPEGKKRHFHGICSRFSQGGQDAEFTAYRMEVVPKLWLLTKRVQSRIFQHQNVPDILKKVLDGLAVKFEIQGTFEKRDFVAQYRESDFDFASRLMEEEGIYYFFKHEAGNHTLVVANTPQSHPDTPEVAKAKFDPLEAGHLRKDDRIYEWEKVQEVRSGKVTLWDHCFELPHKHLEADKTIQDSASVGSVSHKLKVGGNDKLEIYDWPGAYAQRFDGIDRGGGEQPAEVQKIFEDNKRTVAIRMQQEAWPGLEVKGASGCRQFTSGHKFTLEKHFNADGQYVLTSVQHSAQLLGNYRSGDGGYEYHNTFSCIPLAVPFRPTRSTPKPVVRGSQTAVVVGPAGEEIFTDKYGRVKVQFHWDREGKNNADSSCWVRVGTPWAGKQWGMIHIPRIGQEVIVDFLEGDPDQPIIVGSVYNAETMPPYKLPDNKTQSGIVTRSTLKGDPEKYNEIRFEDKKGEEYLYIRAEKDNILAVENDDIQWVGHDRWIEVDNDEETTITNNRTETIEKGNEKLTIKKGNRDVEISMGNETLNIKMGNQTTKLALGKSETEAMQSIELKVGQNSVKIDQTGVTIKGLLVTVEGQAMAKVKSPMTMVNGDGMLTLKGGITMIN